MAKNNFQKFLFPDLNAKLIIRASVIAITAVILFKFILGG